MGIDEDERIKNAKGPSRPVNNVKDRKMVLESISYIDEVVTFSSDSELENSVLNSQASTMVIGSDYKGKRIIGSQHVDEIKFFNRIANYSTTKIVDNL